MFKGGGTTQPSPTRSSTEYSNNNDNGLPFGFELRWHRSRRRVQPLAPVHMANPSAAARGTSRSRSASPAGRRGAPADAADACRPAGAGAARSAHVGGRSVGEGAWRLAPLSDEQVGILQRGFTTEDGLITCPRIALLDAWGLQERWFGGPHGIDIIKILRYSGHGCSGHVC